MRVLRNVIVNRIHGDELLAVSQAPGVIGEQLSLDLVGAGTSLSLRVCVLESRPVIIEGSVRHRIRLRLVPSVETVGLTPPMPDPAASAPAEAL